MSATNLSSSPSKTVSDVKSVASNAASKIPNPAAALSSAQTSIMSAGDSAKSKISETVDAVTESRKKSFLFTGLIADTTKSGTKEHVGPVPAKNVLHSYSSFNTLFSFSVLTADQYNFPESSYKQGKYGVTICRSGSANPEDRVLLPELNKKYDFYIDNVSTSGMMGLDNISKNTNAYNINFTVTEPLSMGMFFESLQEAAIKSGYKNYLDAPYLLILEFVGHKGERDADMHIHGDSLPEKTTKHFAVRLYNIEMTVSAAGAHYFVEAYPYNEHAHSDHNARVLTDISIKGDTVASVLQSGADSLQAVLNASMKKAAPAGTTPDQIVIHFPQTIGTDNQQSTAETRDSGATSKSTVEEKLKVTQGANGTLIQNESEVNTIGLQSMRFDAFKGGIPVFQKTSAVFDKAKNIVDRSKVTYDPSLRTMSFKQNTPIVDIINQVILTSEIGEKALKADQLSPTGKITWWKVETQVFILPGDNKVAGINPKLFVFRVIPYQVDASPLTPANTPTPQLIEAKKQVLRKYDYIYSGQNLDILDFELKFKTGFYTALNADKGKHNELNEAAKNTGALTSQTYTTPQEAPPGNDPTKQNAPVAVSHNRVGTSMSDKGGSMAASSTTIATRQAHELFTTPYDMVQVKLKILGDPYYLGDSGFGNYFASPTDNENVNSSGTVSTTSDVLIELNFRTPVDIDHDSGTYVFANSGKIVPQFSGLYKVVQCDSSFVKGKFEQVLTIYRLPADFINSNQTPKLAVSAAAAELKESNVI